jgi:hypothetical protein
VGRRRRYFLFIASGISRKSRKRILGMKKYFYDLKKIIQISSGNYHFRIVKEILIKIKEIYLDHILT